jgi:hypothetical protein
LDLSIDIKDSSKDIDFDITLLQNRKLDSRITREEEKLHKEFVVTLGKNALWNKFKDEK